MMRYLFLCLLALQVIWLQSVAAAEPKRATVSDYLLRLPDDTFEGTPAVILRFLRQPTCGVEDVANGYLSCTGDGAQPSFEVALFRYQDGRPLLALCQGELEGPDAKYLTFYEEAAGRKLAPVKRSIFPVPEEKGYRFDLPRHGRTIVVRESKNGKVRGKYTWDGEKFRAEK